MTRWSTLALVLICLALASAARAAEGTAGGLSVSLVFPPDVTPRNFFQYELKAGQSRADAIDLTNTSSDPLKVRVYAGDGFNTPDGALTGPLMGQPSQGPGQWISVDASEIVLAPGQSRRVHVKMSVPAVVAAGDYFAFVFLEPEASNAKPQAPQPQSSFRVNISQRLGICLWERVAGELKSGMRISGARKSIEKGHLFLVLGLENTGNTYLKPSGSWTLKSPGGETVAEQAAEEWGYLLPGHPLTLRIPLSTSRPLARGEYKLEIHAQYGSDRVSETVPLTLP